MAWSALDGQELKAGSEDDARRKTLRHLSPGLMPQTFSS